LESAMVRIGTEVRAKVSAGDLEDSYIELFKTKNPRAARLWPYVELLYNAGKLTADHVAGFINDVLTYVPKIADDFENLFTAPFLAAVVNSASLAVSKSASIFDHANLSASKIYSILAHANLSADRTQSILYNMTSATKVADILTCEAADLSVSTSMSISGVNRYGTLSVASGVTLTITGQPGALIVKTLSNSGTIAKSATGGAGGAGGVSGAGAGGTGGGGLVIFANSFGNSGVISAGGGAGIAGTTVTASGGGGAGAAGVFFRVGSGVAGAGGRGGDVSSYYGAGGVNGGGGGGGGPLTYGGAGDGSSYTDFTDYASLATRIRQSVIDWVIVNVFGKSPTSTQAIPNTYGSGGGGGAARDGYAASGGGGGGGGEVLALCVSLNNTGTVSANGGDGGNGGTEGTTDACGGGGGGGIVYALYKTLVSAGTLTATYGVHGATADYHGLNGSAGTASAAAV
jgi:hypothetical protein